MMNFSNTFNEVVLKDHIIFLIKIRNFLLLFELLKSLFERLFFLLNCKTAKD